jgi:hypothetical protein
MNYNSIFNNENKNIHKHKKTFKNGKLAQFSYIFLGASGCLIPALVPGYRLPYRENSPFLETFSYAMEWLAPAKPPRIAAAWRS